MTFQTRDESGVEGAPQELYRFSRGTQVWTFTTADEPLVYGAEAYVPAPFERATIEQGGEASRVGAVTLQLPVTHPFAKNFLVAGALLNESMFCTMYATHRDSEDFWVVLIGAVTEVRMENAGVLSVVIRRAEGRLSRKIPRMKFAKTCQHMFGGPQCAIDVPSLAFVTTITNIDVANNSIMTLDGIADEEVGADAETAMPRRFIGGVVLRGGVVMGHILYRGSGDTVTLMEPNELLETGDTVSVYPACSHGIDDCKLYDNITRFGGFHLIRAYRVPFKGQGLAPVD